MWRCVKTYRKYAQKTGKFVTLKQKISANPEVEKLIGAANFEIQVVANRAWREYLDSPVGLRRVPPTGEHFDQVAEIVHDLKFTWAWTAL